MTGDVGYVLKGQSPQPGKSASRNKLRAMMGFIAYMVN
jgi:hypothetical protein